MKVSLIQPLHADHKLVRKRNGGVFKPAQLTMPYLAACTPPEFEVEIHDEIVRPLDMDAIAGDVVGITAVTPFAPRAYQLADALRAQGRTVIMGGPHATVLPREALQHVDAVVRGEGDRLWPRALRDWRQGRLQPIYLAEAPIPLRDLPRPRWDLLDPKQYIVPQVAQASRGCPNACEFCTLRTVFPGYRTRPVREVVEEVERIPHKHVVLWDDNIAGDPRWAKELFRELAPLKKAWFSQATITVARDRELVELAGKSGCASLFIGLESFSKASLGGANKRFNRVERYREDVKALSGAGITAVAGIVFGFDQDGPDIFERTLEGAIDIGLTTLTTSILVPYPGSDLYARMRAEGRLRTTDWARYTSDELVFEHPRLSARQIVDGHNWVGQQFHRLGSVLQRWWRTRFVRPDVFWLANYTNRRYFDLLPPGRLPEAQRGEPSFEPAAGRQASGGRT